MPVVPQQPGLPLAERAQLVERLTQELSHEGEVGEPLIFENPIGATKKFFAIVVWSAWRDVPVRQRASLILEAYHKYDEGHPDNPKGPHLAMASGMTWDEADAKGLFPYSIEPSASEGLDPRKIHDVMVNEGGIETPSGVKLRFATRDAAVAAFQLLSAKLPEANWTLMERIPSARDD